MQSRHLLADRLARLRNGQFRRTRGGEGMGWASAGFLVPAMARTRLEGPMDRGWKRCSAAASPAQTRGND